MFGSPSTTIIISSSSSRLPQFVQKPLMVWMINESKQVEKVGELDAGRGRKEERKFIFVMQFPWGMSREKSWSCIAFTFISFLMSCAKIDDSLLITARYASVCKIAHCTAYCKISIWRLCKGEAVTLLRISFMYNRKCSWFFWWRRVLQESFLRNRYWHPMKEALVKQKKH